MSTHLTKRRRTQIAALVVLTVVGAFTEFLSLGALFPLISAMVAPDEVASYPVVSWLAQAFGAESRNQLVTLFAALFVGLIVTATTIRLILSYLNTRLAVAIGTGFSCATYQQVIAQPYQRFVQLDSSYLISNIDKTNTLVFT